MHFQTLRDSDVEKLLPDLARLLMETVASGASIGFYAPLSEADAERYWRGVQQGIGAGERILVAAIDDAGALLGTGQLALESRYPNGRHRAEVQKVMVAVRERRKGVASAIMLALEAAARAAKRTLLLLDTRDGDGAARLYHSLGWELAGRVPGYVLEVDGSQQATLIFYRRLETPS